MTWIKASILSVALILSLGSDTFAGDGLGSFCQSIIEGARELRYTWRVAATRGGPVKQLVIGSLAGISHLAWAKGRAQGQSVLSQPIKDEVRDMYLAFDERSLLGSLVKFLEKPRARPSLSADLLLLENLNYFNVSELNRILKFIQSSRDHPFMLTPFNLRPIIDRIAALEKIKEAALKEYNKDSFERRSRYTNWAYVDVEEVGNPQMDRRPTLWHTWRRTGTMSVPDWYFFRRGREDVVVEIDANGNKFVEGRGAPDDLSEERSFLTP